MIPSAPLSPPDRPRRRRVGRSARIVAAVSVAVVVALAGLTGYEYLAQHPPGEPTLVIDTYDSLLGGCGSTLLDQLAGEFEASHHVHLAIQCTSGTLSSLLISEKNAPTADLVIGLDEITAPQAEAAGVLVPYVSPALSNIPPSLVQEISPDHGVTPYESGDLAIDYQPAFYNATRGAVANLSLPELAANPNWSRGLMIEDPETDIVGEEFLLSEIAFYTEVLHQDWTTFWRSVDPGLLVNASWSDAWTAFNVSSGGPPMLSSYATDPAAVAASGTPSFGATLLHWNGTTYAWRAIYGLGIVKGTSHLALDQAFVDWFLGRDVQTALPTSEWEYPANETIPLPTIFQRWAVDPPGVVQLNSAFPPSTIPGAMPGWLDEWQALDNQYG